MCSVSYIQMAQVAASTYGQAQAARANGNAALAAEGASLAGLQGQTLQYYQQTTDQMTTRARQAMADVGSLNAIFADSGVSGNSQERIARVTEGAAITDENTLARNVANRANQTAAEANAISARTVSQINSVRGPSALGAGLQIAGIAANSYDKQNPKKGP